MLVSLAVLGLTADIRAGDEAVVAVSVEPAEVRLVGPDASAVVLVHGRTAAGRGLDLTHEAHFRSLDPSVVTLDGQAHLRPVRDGMAKVEVVAAGRNVLVAVRVDESHARRSFNFENDVVPVLSKLGCNASGCHGKAEGQNGFKLSVFGSDPPADYIALTRESRGRRVFPAAPERSLLLLKMTGGLPHGGGTRCAMGSREYETLRAWVAAGMPFGSDSDPRAVSIHLEPRERALAMRGRQQLRVVARYSDGRETDVTRHAKYQSNNDGLATVDEQGLVTAGDTPGDVAVMAAYMGAVDVFRALVPRTEPLAGSEWPEHNAIDALVFRKLRALNIAPSELATDAEFLRRVSLDVIGTLPTAAEARRFLSDTRSDRRARLVDDLLRRPEYADYWALKWCDLLRVDRAALGHKRAYAFYRWVRRSLAENVPVDRFAREVVTAEGPLDAPGPASFFKVVAKPGEAASALAQVFLGVRIACAECHHHPYDRWSQTDYYGMQAFFTPVGVRQTPEGEAVLAGGDSVAKHPRTGATVVARALGGNEPRSAVAGDRRPELADWLSAPGNPWFARNVANRLWAHFAGRGLVEPVDDVRATNPPSNPELLDALARYLVENDYDVPSLIRWITASRVYQLSARPNVTNERDEQNASRALFKRIDAEVLYDMVCQTTGVAEKFPGVPVGSRAVQLWDSKVPHEFLRMFGRPVRASACECERVAEPSVSQVLHLLNAPALQAKLSNESGTVARLERGLRDDPALVEELYLTFFSRPPDDDERKGAVEYLARHSDRRREAAEDLAWSLINTVEFLFNH
ncbi:MAG: DUF1549 domain-containing protein [Isosphaeraceae bacterium]|nr:DUF1549 domain-containing protein [Isosphaeraceae bacterium]